MKKKLMYNAISALAYNDYSDDCQCSGGASGNRGYGVAVPVPGTVVVGDGSVVPAVPINNNGFGTACGLVCPPLVRLPNFRPKCISPLTFRATLAAGVTTAYIDDFTGIAASSGAIPAGTFQPFIGPNGLTLTNFKNWLATRALFVNSFNLSSTTAADVQQNMRLVNYNIDGTSDTTIISNSLYTLSSSFNPNLINNPQGFVMMDNTALFVSGTPTATLTLTLNVVGSAGYGGRNWSDFALPAGSALCQY